MRRGGGLNPPPSGYATAPGQYKVVYDLSIGNIFNDLESPLTQILRSRKYSTLNIPVIVEDRDIVTMDDE